MLELNYRKWLGKHVCDNTDVVVLDIYMLGLGMVGIVLDEMK